MPAMMTHTQYRKAAATRILVFLLLGFLLPTFISVFSVACSGDSCPVIKYKVGMYGLTTLSVLFAFSFMGITLKRIKDLGLPVYFSFIIPLLMLNDDTVTITLWGTNTYFSLVAAVWIVFLSIVNQESISVLRSKNISFFVLALLLFSTCLCVGNVVLYWIGFFVDHLSFKYSLRMFSRISAQLTFFVSMYYCFVLPQTNDKDNELTIS